MSNLLAPEDVAAIDQTLRRFVATAVAPAAARPELPMPAERLRALTAEAVDLGLLNLDPDPGVGLWEQPGDTTARELSLRCLQRLAAASPGVALHMHQLSLAAWLGRRPGVATGQAAVVSLLVP